MDWETILKVAGGIIAAIGGLLTIGEKLFTWSKSAHQSLKKIYLRSRARKNGHVTKGSRVKVVRTLGAREIAMTTYNLCPRKYYF